MRTRKITFPDILPTIENWNIALIKESLSRTNNHQTKAATLIGMSRQRFHSRIKSYINKK